MLTKYRFHIVALVCAVLAGVYAEKLMQHKPSDSSIQQTDDAYIQADLTAVAPQISGKIVEVDVADYQHVHVGDPMLRIDQKPFAIAVARAEAGVDQARADLNGFESRIEQSRSAVRQGEARITIDTASLALAKANKTRFTNLAQDGSGTELDRQKAETEYLVRTATLQQGQAALDGAKSQITILETQQAQAAANLASAQAQLEQAKLQLSYTLLQAPVDGIIAKNTARPGSFAHQGQALFTLVPANNLYVDANFRETQLSEIHEGQRAEILVDALPGLSFQATVERLAPTSGVILSPIQAHNATGNFTKIVQRLMVRLRFDENQPNLNQLKIGMSVRPSIFVR